MSLFKREKTWWTDFSINGVRYRMSLNTTDWREAQSQEKEKIAQASAGKIGPTSQQFARLAFTEAADRYVEDRKGRLGKRSLATEEERLKPLRRYFGSTPLNRIGPESIRTYIAERKKAPESQQDDLAKKVLNRCAANRTINMEIGILRRILKRAKRWHLISDEVQLLPERHNIGRALAKEDKLRLLSMAASRPEWQVARLATILALNTTMRASEIRALQFRDIDFFEHMLTVRQSKTDAGVRIIPLNADAWSAILELRNRAKLLSGTEPQPEWYLFPHGEGQGPVTSPKTRPGPKAISVKPDPTEPITTWRTAWRKLTRKAGLPGLRFHDLRHHAITELAESAASDQTIMAIAGHVSPQMLAHYSHVRLEAKRKALDQLSTHRATASYGTTNDTKSEKVTASS